MERPVYVPGWDCHGLPIEWKIEEQYKKNKKIKMKFLLLNLEKNVGHLLKNGQMFIKNNLKDQSNGDWENYYSTMSYDAEAQIVRELGKYLRGKSI